MLFLIYKIILLFIKKTGYFRQKNYVSLISIFTPKLATDILKLNPKLQAKFSLLDSLYKRRGSQYNIKEI